MKNEHKSTSLNVRQTWIPKSSKTPVENTVQSKLSVHHSAKAHLTWAVWHIRDPVKRSGGSATLCSPVLGLSSPSPQSAGNCKQCQIPHFCHKTSRLQAVSPYSAALTQSASTRQKTAFLFRRTGAMTSFSYPCCLFMEKESHGSELDESRIQESHVKPNLFKALIEYANILNMMLWGVHIFVNLSSRAAWGPATLHWIANKIF